MASYELRETIEGLHCYNIFVKTREIFLHSYFNEESDNGIEYRMANRFLKNIRLLESISPTLPIFVHQQSIGGEWESAMLIYDAIKTCSAPVVVITHGVAASMGSVIPQAADLRITMPNCCWLIHEGTTGIHPEQTIKASVSWGDWEKRLSVQLMEIYISVCIESEKYKGKTAKQVSSYIKKRLDSKQDWFLNCEEAIYYGFCDAVYGSEGYETLADLKDHVYRILQL